jgi:YidC/Oxa1 family membrane protein insertase
MNFDRNTVIGFIVLAVLFIGYFFYTSREQQAFMREKARLDSIAATRVPVRDTAIVRQDLVVADSLNQTTTAGEFSPALNTPEQLTTVENKVMKVVFTSKGGQPKAIELKNYTGIDTANAKIASSEFDKLIYRINTGANQTADIVNFNFTSTGVSKNADGSQTISFQLQSAENTSIVHQYLLKDDQYMIDFNLQLNGVSQLLTNNELNLTWQNRALQLQKDLSYEKQQSQISDWVLIHVLLKKEHWLIKYMGLQQYLKDTVIAMNLIMNSWMFMNKME